MVSLCVMIASKDQLGSGLHLLQAESIMRWTLSTDPLKKTQPKMQQRNATSRRRGSEGKGAEVMGGLHDARKETKGYMLKTVT